MLHVNFPFIISTTTVSTQKEKPQRKASVVDVLCYSYSLLFHTIGYTRKPHNGIESKPQETGNLFDLADGQAHLTRLA